MTVILTATLVRAPEKSLLKTALSTVSKVTTLVWLSPRCSGSLPSSSTGADNVLANLAPDAGIPFGAAQRLRMHRNLPPSDQWPQEMSWGDDAGPG